MEKMILRCRAYVDYDPFAETRAKVRLGFPAGLNRLTLN